MIYKKQFVTLIVCLKVVLFVFLAQQFRIHQPERVMGHFFVKKGESLTYIKPVEHLINGKGYSLERYDQNTSSFELQPTARRMPGIVPVLLPLRLIMPETLALDSLILIQFFLSVLSAFILGKIVFQFTSSIKASYFTVFLFALSSFTGVYDHMGLAESLSISTSILSIYFFTRLKWSFSYTSLAVSGLFLTWSIFLRPAIVLLVPLMATSLFLISKKRYSIGKAVGMQLVLFSSLTIALSAWTARNYLQFNSLIVFEDSVFDSMSHIYTPAEKALRPLINHWGGQRKKFYPNTMGAYFYGQSDDQTVFPEIVFSPSFTRDSLEQFRILFQNANTAKNDSRLNNAVTNRSIQLMSDFENRHPFYYHVHGPLKSLVRFYFIKTEHQLPFPAKSEMNLFQFLFKAFNIILYNLIAVFALIGFVVYTVQNRGISFILLFPLLYTLVLGCVLYNTEVRYLASAFPFLIILAVIAILSFIRRFKPTLSNEFK